MACDFLLTIQPTRVKAHSVRESVRLPQAPHNHNDVYEISNVALLSLMQRDGCQDPSQNWRVMLLPKFCPSSGDSSSWCQLLSLEGRHECTSINADQTLYQGVVTATQPSPGQQEGRPRPKQLKRIKLAGGARTMRCPLSSNP